VTELGPLLERVRLAVFDFDGVFTDNRVWVEVKPLARWVLSRAGGTGCVREFCDAVWEAQR
jgi:3-deoxy-D-manno-octulosonate 8-phosphate phosphatase KdsC-like HAD superfamily phosphatase